MVVLQVLRPLVARVQFLAETVAEPASEERAAQAQLRIQAGLALSDCCQIRLQVCRRGAAWPLPVLMDLRTRHKQYPYPVASYRIWDSASYPLFDYPRQFNLPRTCVLVNGSTSRCLHLVYRS